MSLKLSDRLWKRYQVSGMVKGSFSFNSRLRMRGPPKISSETHNSKAKVI